MSDAREYSAFGKVLDEFARKRGVRGPEAISDHLWDAVRYDISDESVYEYLHGYDRPDSDFNWAFAQAFELDELEMEVLAWVYVYGKRPER